MSTGWRKYAVEKASDRQQAVEATMSTLFETARQLATAHRQTDPATRYVYLVPSADEVRLIEVSGSLGSSPSGTILPFHFRAQPEEGVHYPSALVLLSEDEWERVQSGELKLPAGWDDGNLTEVL